MLVSHPLLAHFVQQRNRVELGLLRLWHTRAVLFRMGVAGSL